MGLLYDFTHLGEKPIPCIEADNIKWSTVEIQAQHRPSRLKKPRTESVGTDRLGRVPSRLGPIGDAEKDIP